MTAEAPWQCKPEFSTVKMDGVNKELTARCRWNRTVSVPAEFQETRRDFVVSRHLSRSGDTNERSFECSHAVSATAVFVLMTTAVLSHL